MFKEQEEQRPFETVLDELITGDDVSISHLYRLSDMTPREMAIFRRRWPEIPLSRRRVIVRHLVDICEENYRVDFSPVFSFCFDDEAAEVRAAALDGIWDISDTSLVGPVLELLIHDPVMDVRRAAAAALSHYVLMSEWGQIPRSVSPRIVEVLLAEYEKADTAVPVKRAALEAMGAASHPRIDQLIKEAYHGEDEGMQVSALFAMGNSADEQWLPDVLAEMDSERPEMRLEAARAAGTIGHEEALPGLAALLGDDDLEIQLAAVHAVGQIGGDAAYRMLSTMAGDEDFAPLHQAVSEAMEEMNWLGGEFDMDMLDIWPDDPMVDDDEPLLDWDE
jgi:hypothetical protein